MLAKAVMKAKQNTTMNTKQQNKSKIENAPPTQHRTQSCTVLQKRRSRVFQQACVRPWVLSQALPRHEQKDEGEQGSFLFVGLYSFFRMSFSCGKKNPRYLLIFGSTNPSVMLVSLEELLPAMSGAHLSGDGLGLVGLSALQDRIYFAGKPRVDSSNTLSSRQCA